MKKLILISFVLMCLCSAAARADLITIKISGQVTGFNDDYGKLQNQVYVGAPISGTYTYDSTALDTNPSSDVGTYWQYTNLAGLSLTVGDLNFRTNPTNVSFLLGVSNNNGLGEDVYWLHSYNNSPLSNGALIDDMSWQLNDATETALSSDALPLTAPDLSKWSGNLLGIDGNMSSGFGISATIASADLVPEPATMLILAFGSLLMRKRA